MIDTRLSAIVVKSSREGSSRRDILNSILVIQIERWKKKKKNRVSTRFLWEPSGNGALFAIIFAFIRNGSDSGNDK